MGEIILDLQSQKHRAHAQGKQWSVPARYGRVAMDGRLLVEYDGLRAKLLPAMAGFRGCHECLSGIDQTLRVDQYPAVVGMGSTGEPGMAAFHLWLRYPAWQPYLSPSGCSNPIIPE